MFSFDAERQMMPHPILLEVRQTGLNQILMTYDKRTDLASASNVANYWIRSNMPVGIASVGMKDALTAENAIRPDMAMITPADNSMMRYFMTFRANVVSGAMYTVLPCFVNLEGMTGFREKTGPRLAEICLWECNSDVEF
jgi:hypothetical protein